MLTGPLAPELYDPARPLETWWHASAPPPRRRPPLDGDLEAEVAIVGAGYAGLSAARALARRGVSAVALDAGEIGWGASGRNGGIAGPGGHKLDDDALIRRVGAEEFARYTRAQAENLDHLRAFCHAAGLGDQVQGSAERVFAHSPRIARTMQGTDFWPGFTTEPIAPVPGPGIARHGGIALAPAFAIHPLRLVRALADRAEDDGARLFPRSPVTAWHRERPGGAGAHRLVTSTGSVRTTWVLIATNGFTPDGLSPLTDARALPVISTIAVTRPLEPGEHARHRWMGDDPMADSRNMLCYFRLLPERRLLFGMRGDLMGKPSAQTGMRARLRSRIARELPGLEHLDFDHFWCGPVCATARLTPAVGWLDRTRRVAVALGWHGSGIGSATLGGRLAGGLIADAIDGADGPGKGEDAIPAPMRGAPPRIPLPGLRPLYVGAASIALGLADRFG